MGAYTQNSYYPYFQMRIEMLHKHFNKGNLSKYALKLEIGLDIKPLILLKRFCEFGLSSALGNSCLTLLLILR